MSAYYEKRQTSQSFTEENLLEPKLLIIILIISRPNLEEFFFSESVQ